MTTETKPQPASEKAAVMIAFDRGEKVESKPLISKIWGRDYSPSWDWQCFEWRVMAKPIEYWVWAFPDGSRSIFAYDSKHKAENVYKKYEGRAVFMREVI